MSERAKYIERINRVLDYIDTHYSEEIKLDRLSEVAQFSKFHFHRIFHAFTGEALYSYVSRIRVERAAARLLSDDRSITEAAFSSGFNDSASFSRAFKKRFNLSPSQWLEKQKIKQNTQSHSKSKNDQDKLSFPEYNGISKSVKNVNNGVLDNEKFGESGPAPLFFEEIELPPFSVAYIRHTGPYRGDYGLFASLYRKVNDWFRSEGLTEAEEGIFSLGRDLVIYHDSEGITDPDRLKISVGKIIRDSLSPSGEIGVLTAGGGRYLRCRFELRNGEYGSAWTGVFRDILPQAGKAGLLPREGFSFELYPMDCYNPENGKTIVDICIPVEDFQ